MMNPEQDQSWIGQMQAEEVATSSAMKDKRPTVLKLVPEFSGHGDVSEWLEKVHTICYLNDIRADNDIVYIITLRLKGEAYRVVQQMDVASRCSSRRVQNALLTAYEPNVYDAYNMFRARYWKEDECVDGYLSALKKLAKLGGGAEERMLMAAFVGGLPSDVQTTIRSGMGANQLKLTDVVEQARQIVNKRGLENAKCLAVTDGQRRTDQPRTMTCFRCKKTGHFSRNCPTVTCYKCEKQGHVSRACPKNVEQRGEQRGEQGNDVSE